MEVEVGDWSAVLAGGQSRGERAEQRTGQGRAGRAEQSRDTRTWSVGVSFVCSWWWWCWCWWSAGMGRQSPRLGTHTRCDLVFPWAAGGLEPYVERCMLPFRDSTAVIGESPTCSRRLSLSTRCWSLIYIA